MTPPECRESNSSNDSRVLLYISNSMLFRHYIRTWASVACASLLSALIGVECLFACNCVVFVLHVYFVSKIRKYVRTLLTLIDSGLINTGD
jgi:hypothetical protein